MTTSTVHFLTDMQQRVSELFNIDSVSKIDTIIQELEGYGIDNEETLDDYHKECIQIAQPSHTLFSIAA